MRRVLYLSTILVGLIVMASCSNDTPSPGSNNSSPVINNPVNPNTPRCDVNDEGWTISTREVFDGGPGKDGIPSIDNPVFISLDQARYMTEDDLIVGVAHEGQYRAYPHRILDRHEIVNDQIGDFPFALTFCYLTGTALSWSRVIDGQQTTFGVSGLLHNSNLIPYDRRTDTRWSQLRIEAVNGPLVCERPTTHMVLETSWSNWKRMYPESLVLSTETGFDRDYARPPLSAQITDETGLVFPVDPLDERLPLYERVHGIITSTGAKVYPLNEFAAKPAIIKEPLLLGVGRVIIVGARDANFVVSFLDQMPDGSPAEFSVLSEGQLPAILRDQEGNVWDIWGYALEGPRKGQRLKTTQSFMGYWFAFGAFYPDAEIYNGSQLEGR